MIDEEDFEDEDYSQTEEKLRKKIKEIDKKIDSYRIKTKDDNRLKLIETVFDEKTRLILFNNINKGRFNSITGAISTGKEANVYYAITKKNAIAIKIFRIDAPSFKNMKIYVEGDYRFKKFTTKRAGFIELWAKKEFKNLQRIREHGVPVPKPIHIERNILMMEFLGNGESALPQLKDVFPEEPSKLYKQIMENVKTIYRDAKLVHGDLSAYNILFDELKQQHFIIDVSQAVLNDHPKSEDFLLRDLFNLNKYFNGLGVQIIELERLYGWVTGFKPNPIKILQFKS